MKIVFATNNSHKLNEIKNALLTGNLKGHSVSGLQEMGIYEEIPETHETLEGNAVEKARYIYDKYSLSCFADDTGLEVRALDDRPGVFSARYAGENCTFEDNVNKLLSEMRNIEHREACFRTVIAFAHEDKIEIFEGRIEGIITKVRMGLHGFGYDPVFMPKGYNKTFAQMNLEEKNSISHRALALNKLIKYLNKELF